MPGTIPPVTVKDVAVEATDDPIRSVHVPPLVPASHCRLYEITGEYPL